MEKLKLFPFARLMALSLFGWSALASFQRALAHDLLSEALIACGFVFLCVLYLLQPLVFAAPTAEFRARKAAATIGSAALHRFLSMSGLICLAGGYAARYLLEA